MPKPYTPTEAREVKKGNLPKEVIETVNYLLAKNISSDSKRVIIYQEDIIEILETKYNMQREDIFANKCLDFEPLYRDYGWEVKYDKPAWDENYKTHFIFTSKTSF